MTQSHTCFVPRSASTKTGWWFSIVRVVWAGMILALATSVAHAQTQQPARAPAVSTTAPSHIEAARRVVDNSGMTRNFSVIIPQLIDQARLGYTRQRPELVRELEESFLAVTAAAQKEQDELTLQLSQFYAARMTEQELNDIATFFGSGAGQKYVTTQPQMLEEIYAAIQAWGQKMTEFVNVQVRAEMKKRGHDL